MEVNEQEDELMDFGLILGPTFLPITVHTETRFSEIYFAASCCTISSDFVT